VAKQLHWVDAPQAFTEVRNALVHANPNKRQKLQGLTGRAMLEVWNLGVWFLELTLLRIYGYTGSYGNRLNMQRWQGEVEPVPWAVVAEKAP
jgi:hypothetical protein